MTISQSAAVPGADCHVPRIISPPTATTDKLVSPHYRGTLVLLGARGRQGCAHLAVTASSRFGVRTS
ncbi:MAG: hypothetical protein ACK5MR_06435 [Cumulibacter sp.]